MPNALKTADPEQVIRGLQEENLALRQRIREHEAEAERFDARQRVLCRSIKLGHWEWEYVGDDDRPAFLCEEMANIICPEPPFIWFH